MSRRFWPTGAGSIPVLMIHQLLVALHTWFLTSGNSKSSSHWLMVICKSIICAYTVEATCASYTRVAVRRDTSGFFKGGGFSFAATLLVVGRAYAVSFALANGWTSGWSSSSSTSSGVIVGGRGVGHWVMGIGPGANAGTGVGVDRFGVIGALATGSGLRAFWAQVWTPGASSRECMANSSFSRDTMHSSEESWRMPTFGLGNTPSKSTLVIGMEARFWWFHSSRQSLKVLLATVPGTKHLPGRAMWPSSCSMHFPSWMYSFRASQLLFQCSPPQKY